MFRKTQAFHMISQRYFKRKNVLENQSADQFNYEFENKFYILWELFSSYNTAVIQSTQVLYKKSQTAYFVNKHPSPTTQKTFPTTIKHALQLINRINYHPEWSL